MTTSIATAPRTPEPHVNELLLADWYATDAQGPVMWGTTAAFCRDCVATGCPVLQLLTAGRKLDRADRDLQASCAYVQDYHEARGRVGVQGVMQATRCRAGHRFDGVRADGAGQTCSTCKADYNASRRLVTA